MKNITRRSFVKTSAGAAALFSILPSFAAEKKAPPSERLNVAVIGAGGRGFDSVSALHNFDKSQIVALCDVDDGRAKGAFDLCPDAKRFKDYRVMFDKIAKDIDAVVVATPDHVHFPAAAWAMANGKHVYVEKPLARTVWEAQELKRIAKKTGLITQMGNQGHAGDGWRKVKEWYDAGLLGELIEIHHWTDRPVPGWWAQGALPRPDGKEKVPASLDWNLWLNVAPEQPYSGRIVPFKWRGMRDFGTSSLGDMGCHFLDIGYSAFDLGLPLSVEGKPSESNDFSWPQECSVVYEFAPKKSGGENVKLYWFDYKNKPKDVRGMPQEAIDKADNGTIIVCKNYTVFCDNPYGANPSIMPRETMRELLKDGKLPAPTIPRVNGGPQVEWAGACIEGKQPGSNIAGFSGDFATVVLMGLAPVDFPNEKLIIDPKKMLFTSNKAANRLLQSRYAYRKEFLPGKI